MTSDRSKRIKPSPTLSIDAKAKAMMAQGIDIVNFGVGEPDFDTPEHIKEAAIKAIRDGFTKYTPAGGIDELKKAVVAKFQSDNNLTYREDEVIVSCGAKHSLYNIAQALFGPGDEVIILSPYWVSYPEQVLLNDAIPVFVKTYKGDNFMIRPDLLESKITKRTKAMILNSPSNPTGSTYDKSRLEAIAEIALRHNIYIISDEVYEKIIYDDTKHISIASLSNELKRRTIVVNGLSKAYAMTGWRIGYAAGPREIIQAMTNIQSQSTSNPTSIAQKASVAALTGPQDFISLMHSEFDKRRRFLVDGLNSIDDINCLQPTGAFYVFPDVSKLYGKKTELRELNSSLDMAIYLLEDAMVALAHGEAFGDDNCMRISYATSIDNIDKGLKRIREVVSKLR